MKIIEYIKKPFKKKIGLLKKKLILLVGLLIGFALIFTATFSLSGVSLAVCLGLGGILVLGSWAKTALDAYGNKAVKLDYANKIFQENNQLKMKQAVLENEIRSVRDSKVKVLNIRPILELGLFEADCQIHKCFDEYYNKNDQPIQTIKDKSTGLVNETRMRKLDTVKKRFMGTLRVNFVARYGIDMQKMKVKIDDDLRVVEVQGVEPKYRGCKGFPKTQWMYSVSLRKNWMDDWVSDVEAKAIEGMSKDRCRALTEKSLQRGPEELEWLKQPLHNTIRSFLLATVVPSGYTLKLVDRLEGKYVRLLECLGDERQPKTLPKSNKLMKRNNCKGQTQNRHLKRNHKNHETNRPNNKTPHPPANRIGKELKISEKIIGTVSDFFAHPVVAGIELTAVLKVGDKIRIKGHTTDLEMTVDSMQIDNAQVTVAKAGDSIGVKVSDKVRSGDKVYKITD